MLTFWIRQSYICVQCIYIRFGSLHLPSDDPEKSPRLPSVSTESPKRMQRNTYLCAIYKWLLIVLCIYVEECANCKYNFLFLLLYSLLCCTCSNRVHLPSYFHIYMCDRALLSSRRFLCSTAHYKMVICIYVMHALLQYICTDILQICTICV